MAEYRQKPTEFTRPTDAELAAQNKRNIAIALSLVAFILFVFFTMISRGQSV